MTGTNAHIVIIDYGMGNLASTANMLRKIGANADVTNEQSAIEKADALILPGVGAFDAGMRNLGALGLAPILERRVMGDGIPILGICLGMQLFGLSSEEGILPGLGWVAARCRRFRSDGDRPSLKVPHMGWNEVKPLRSHPIISGLETGARFYFVHSYHMECDLESDILARTFYGAEFVSMIAHGNIFGVQFHPEKSHKFGMNLLKNFSVIAGCRFTG
jgi:glutamine amidotransferase